MWCCSSWWGCPWRWSMERPALGLSMWLALWQVGRWAHVRRGKSPQGGWETSWRGKPHISGGHSALITKAPDEGYRPTSPGRLERGLHLDRRRVTAKGGEHSVWNRQTTRVSIFTPPRCSCASLGKFLNLSWPHLALSGI